MDLGYEETKEVFEYLGKKGCTAKRSTMVLNRLKFSAITIMDLSPGEETYNLLYALKKDLGVVPALDKTHYTRTRAGARSLKFVPVKINSR